MRTSDLILKREDYYYFQSMILILKLDYYYSLLSILLSLSGPSLLYVSLSLWPSPAQMSVVWWGSLLWLENTKWFQTNLAFPEDILNSIDYLFELMD